MSEPLEETLPMRHEDLEEIMNMMVLWLVQDSGKINSEDRA